MSGGAAFGKFAFDDVLGGDAGMIRAWDPERGPAGHTIVADEHVLDSAGDGVAEVEGPGDVWRGHGDDEGRGIGIGQAALNLLFRAEETHRLPPFVEFLFPLPRFVNLGHFLTRSGQACRCHCSQCSHRLFAGVARLDGRFKCAVVAYASFILVLTKNKPLHPKDEVTPRYHLG